MGTVNDHVAQMAVPGAGFNGKLAGLASLFAAATDGDIPVYDSGTGLWSAEPLTAVLPTQSAYTQTFATASKTHPAVTSAAVATTGSTLLVPAGYTTTAQADAIVAAINAIRVDVDNVKRVVNALIDDLQALALAG